MRAGLLIAVGAGLLLLASRRAPAADQSRVNLPPGESWDAPEYDAYSMIDAKDSAYDSASWFDATGYEGMFFDSLFPTQGGDMSGSSPELEAFLGMIRATEVGRLPDPDRYGVTYGYRRFTDFSDHPVRNKQFPTGEFTGVPLSDEMCRKVGLPPGCVSTAAGAYQFIRSTWERLRAAGKWGARLPDFSPASQDEAARRLLRQIGVAGRLASGDIEGAIMLAGTQWASLPGSSAGQNPVALRRALSLYQTALATGGSVPTA